MSTHKAIIFADYYKFSEFFSKTLSILGTYSQEASPSALTYEDQIFEAS